MPSKHRCTASSSSVFLEEVLGLGMAGKEVQEQESWSSHVRGGVSARTWRIRRVDVFSAIVLNGVVSVASVAPMLFLYSICLRVCEKTNRYFGREGFTRLHEGARLCTVQYRSCSGPTSRQFSSVTFPNRRMLCLGSRRSDQINDWRQ
jgi:hypothetical protein